MRWEEHFQSTLSALGYPVSQEPAGAAHETYLTFNLIRTDPTSFSSNQPRRLRHTVQVHIFTTRDDGIHRALLPRVLWALRRAGVHVYQFGPDLYEAETGCHHMPITCEWAEGLEEGAVKEVSP